VNSLPSAPVCSYTRITGRNNCGFSFWCLTYLVHSAADRVCSLLPTAFVRLSVTCQRFCQVNSSCFVSTVRTGDVMTANQNTAHVICVRYSTHPVFNNITPTHNFGIYCRFEIISPLFTGRNETEATCLICKRNAARLVLLIVGKAATM
jgi:hypothetical protein